MSYTVLQCPVLTAKERPHPPLFAADESAFRAVRRFDARRIFDSIRRLGGMSRPKVKCYDLRSTRALRVEGDAVLDRNNYVFFVFLSTPSGWRATSFLSIAISSDKISIHALRVEGDRGSQGRRGRKAEFLSTPSGWRATAGSASSDETSLISIHALRVEGDPDD